MSKKERKNLKRRLIRNHTIMWAWYSPLAAQRVGTCTYLKRDGDAVEITLVTHGNHHKSGWEDIRYVGKVTKCLRANNKMRLGLASGYFDYEIRMPSYMLTCVA